MLKGKGVMGGSKWKGRGEGVMGEEGVMGGKGEGVVGGEEAGEYKRWEESVRIEDR